MTTTTEQPQSDRRSPGSNNNHHQKHNRRDRRENERKHAHPPVRRSAADLVAHPPHGYTVQVLELDDDKEARKRLRLLVLTSDNGYRVLPLMSIRTPKKTQTSDGSITVIDDLDILPANYVESALEVNLISDDVLLRFAEIVADFRERQKHVVPSHKKPLVQRPFEELSVELQEKVEEDDMAKKIAAAKAAAPKQPAKAPARPQQPAPTRSRGSRGDAWWWASIC